MLLFELARGGPAFSQNTPRPLPLNPKTMTRNSKTPYLADETEHVPPPDGDPEVAPRRKRRGTRMSAGAREKSDARWKAHFSREKALKDAKAELKELILKGANELAEQRGMTREQIRDLLYDEVFAEPAEGTETTSTSTLTELAIHIKRRPSAIRELVVKGLL
jgi:hypothetical protein